MASRLRIDVGAAVDRARESGLVGIQRYFDTHAEQLLGGLRRNRPVLSLGRTVIVTRRDDVLAILRDPDTFALPYRARLRGPFVLGQDGPEHQRSRHELGEVFEHDDLALIEKLTTQAAQRRVDQAVPGGALDVGTDLVHPVVHAIVAAYLGLSGVSPSVQLAWARDIFQDLFLDVPGLPGSVRARAERATAEMHTYVDALIDARRKNPTDDLVSRMLLRKEIAPETALDDLAIKDNLIGLAIAWLWNTSKAALMAIDGLLDRPEEALEPARAAAERGDLDGVRRVLWEVLRFHPVQSGLPRICLREVLLAPGTSRETLLRPGTVVFVGTQSAMWDETAVPDPTRFDPSRPEDQYLIFGEGPHRCLGEQLMRVQLAAMLTPLLTSGPVRRSAGRAGRLRWSGPHPDGLRVDLGPQGA